LIRFNFFMLQADVLPNMGFSATRKRLIKSYECNQDVAAKSASAEEPADGNGATAFRGESSPPNDGEGDAAERASTDEPEDGSSATASRDEL
jgi:hypothetical protein